MWLSETCRARARARLMAQRHRPAAVLSDSYVPDWSIAKIAWDNPPGPKKRPDGSVKSVNRINGSTLAHWAASRKTWEREALVLPRPGSTTVVMCLAWSYPIERFRQYVGSLRAHYRGDVVMLLAGQPPPEIHEYLVANRITQVPVVTIADHILHRFSDFSRICSAYQRCISTDFRDVFFQADPFAADGAGAKADAADLVFQLEELQVRDCPHNSMWIKQGWGMEALDEFGHKHILCSGVVVGSPKGFEAMAARMPPARPRFEHLNSSGNCQTETGRLRQPALPGKGCSRQTPLYGPLCVPCTSNPRHRPCTDAPATRFFVAQLGPAHPHVPRISPTRIGVSRSEHRLPATWARRGQYHRRLFGKVDPARKRRPSRRRETLPPP